jgi:hypothetical protein
MVLSATYSREITTPKQDAFNDRNPSLAIYRIPSAATIFAAKVMPARGC